ncbi:hypothetical protein SAMN04487764_1539 [Gillisia sp. Hel1_33_143]|uniref:hypothetical protein n=1 Tax=Gillisia sp. Hel1_33_143 TaxID=1336796 RepID=UPI00087D9825|nr:hypothetical protein [Gillisia sp. Hel1_33_143]SDS13866.1 hypothetical protein SAMN04487764_1539 [Gillisia sp. Hel1_33_143]
MISATQSIQLKDRIGGNYLAKISIYFNQHMIFNKFNQPFSTSYLSRVINRKQSNKKVEDGMFALAKELKEKEEREAVRRAKILEPVTPPDHE